MRIHLIFVTLLLAFPAALLIVHTGYEKRDDVLEESFLEARMLANRIVSEQQAAAAAAKQLVMVLAHLPEVRTHQTAAVNAILAGVLQQNPQYGNVVITDISGFVWASALPYKRPFSLHNRRTFYNTRQARQFSSGEYCIGTISNQVTSGFGYPVLGTDGRLDSIILVNINFEHLKHRLSKEGFPKDSAFLIADHDGIVVDSSHFHPISQGKRLPDGLFNRIRQGQDEHTFIAGSTDGSEQIYSYRKLQLSGEQSPYLYIVVSIPLTKVLTTARQAQYTSIVLLTIFFAPAIALALWIGKHCFINKINMLHKATQRLAEGDLTVRASEAVHGGELGALGQSFDEMAHKLEAREQALLNSSAELDALNRSLSQKVDEETARRVKHERLLARHARMAAMGEMIGAIAHQWRQPLATLGAIIQSIRIAWDLKRIDSSFVKSAEADAQKQLYFMSDTIEDFRNFFSPDKLEELFDIRLRIREATQLIAAQFANSGVALDMQDLSPGHEMYCQGYPNEFKHAVINLVSNAFDAIGAKLATVHPADNGLAIADYVRITLSREIGRIIIEVSDTGGGIPEEYLDKIFEPYFTSKPGGKGTGLGLYMSRLIIEESMGGKLSVANTLAGAIFRIELPVESSADGELHG